MTLWEIAACADGHAKANGVKQEVEAPSIAEHEEMLQMVSGLS